MDTDTREEFFERYAREVYIAGKTMNGVVADANSLWDFIEQKLKQARIDEIDRAYEAGDVCRCDGEKILAVQFSYFSERLAELRE